MYRATFISVLVFLSTLPWWANAQPEQKPFIAVLDSDVARIDCAGFAETLEAYVSDVGVDVSLLETLSVPADHNGWVALAEREGIRTGAFAVMWFEPTEEGTDTYNVYLVLMEQESKAVIVVPVELGMRRGPEMFRVLAATTRMVLDTELLEDLRAVAMVSRKGKVPPPGPMLQTKTPHQSRVEESPEPSRPQEVPKTVSPAKRDGGWGLALGYLGDLGFGGPRVLQGVRLSLRGHLEQGLALHLDVAYLGSRTESAADLDFREERVPLRAGLGWYFPLGATTLEIIGFWALEIIWASTKVTERSEADPETAVNPDTGGGAMLRWRVPLWKSLGFFVSLSGQVMAVSHKYTREGVGVIEPSYFRMQWSVGVDIFTATRSGKAAR